MPRPGLRLRGRVPKPPLWPQTPIVARSDRPTDGDVGTARLAGATDAARRLGRWGRGGRALSSSGRGSEPRTCAQAQPSRKSRVAGGWSRRCHPLPESDAKAAGSRAPGLRGRKGRAVTVSSIGNIAPSPGPAPSRLRPGLCPRPAPRGGGLSHPSSERVRPLFPHPQQLSAAFGAPRGGLRIPAHTRGRVHASRPLLHRVRSQECRHPHPHLSSFPRVPLSRSRPYTTTHGTRVPPSPLPIADPKSPGLFVSGYGPLDTPLGPSQEHSRYHRVDNSGSLCPRPAPVAQDFVLHGSDVFLSTTPPPAWAKARDSARLLVNVRALPLLGPSGSSPPAALSPVQLEQMVWAWGPI